MNPNQLIVGKFYRFSNKYLDDFGDEEYEAFLKEGTISREEIANVKFIYENKSFYEEEGYVYDFFEPNGGLYCFLEKELDCIEEA